MSALFCMPGRRGDILMSLPALMMLTAKNLEKMSLAINPEFFSIADFLLSLDIPLKDVVPLNYKNCMDDFVFGSSLASYSDKALEAICPGYDYYINAALPCVPPCHIADFICYKTGLASSTQRFVNGFHVKTKSMKLSGDSNIVVCHLGGGDLNRHIRIPDKISDKTFICIGGEADPCEDWMEDARGLSIIEIIDLMLNSSLVIGSDSLMTHLSSLIGVDTCCFHTDELSRRLSNREMYLKGKSFILGKQDLSIKFMKECYISI